MFSRKLRRGSVKFDQMKLKYLSFKYKGNIHIVVEHIGWAYIDLFGVVFYGTDYIKVRKILAEELFKLLNKNWKVSSQWDLYRISSREYIGGAIDPDIAEFIGYDKLSHTYVTDLFKRGYYEEVLLSGFKFILNNLSSEEILQNIDILSKDPELLAMLVSRELDYLNCYKYDVNPEMDNSGKIEFILNILTTMNLALSEQELVSDELKREYYEWLRRNLFPCEQFHYSFIKIVEYFNFKEFSILIKSMYSNISVE